MRLEVKSTASFYNLEAHSLVFSTPEALRKQIQLLQDALNDRAERMEFFDDGIYIDGNPEPLKLRGKHEAILRCFEFLDKVPVLDLIYKVWGSSDVKENNVSVTISTLNRELVDYGITIERDGEFYKILK